MTRAHGNRCDLGPLRIYLIAASATLMFVPLATQWALQQNRLPTPEEWQKAERDIKRLSPSAFKELPMSIVKQLQARGCTVPQAAQISEPHNAIRGEFARSGQMDWAVLCSNAGQSLILLFWGRPTGCAAELAKQEDRHSLQTWVEPRIAYSRAIAPLGKDAILKFYKWFGGPKPPPLDHQGIDDAMIGKYSVIHYCYQGKWLQLQGAD
jgi:hypothetical protein